MGRSYAFEARVVENRLPDLFVLAVQTSSGNSRVTNRFTAEDDGTRYSKVVEVAPRGVF